MSTTPAQRLRRMHDLLYAAYGPQHWWPARDSFEVILGAYLTQNTAWSSVERSLENLRAAQALSLDAMRVLSIEELMERIRPSGFATRKAAAIKAFVAMLDEECGGSLAALADWPTEAARQRLLDLPGVGPETADAILLYALGHATPVADEYLRRLTQRHGLLEAGRNRKGYQALVTLAEEAFAGDPPGERRELLNEFHALTVAVGKAHCRRTPACEGCPLASELSAVD